MIYGTRFKLIMNGIIKRRSPNTSGISEQDQGAQGFVEKCVWNNKPAVVKTSNHIDFVLELEEEVWNRLKILDSIHFCKVLSKHPLSPGERRFRLFFEEIRHYETEISLRNKSKKPITNNGKPRFKNNSLANIIYEAKHKPAALINCINQTLAAIAMFEKMGITHYDLHADNVMITNTENDVHIYKLNNDNIVSIKTYGISPVIIDFGMAYIPRNRYNATCMFSNNGFTTFMADPLVDARLLLLTSVKDLPYTIKDLKKSTLTVVSNLRRNLGQTISKRNYVAAKTKNTTPTSVVLGCDQNKGSSDVVKLVEHYVRKVRLMFTPLKLEDNGWFHDNCFSNIIDDLADLAPKILTKRKGGIFKKDNYKWMLELMQHEIELPLKNSGNYYNNKQLTFNKAILLFASEWVLVEQIIRNTKEEQLFLKDLVSINDDFESYLKMKHRFPKIKNLKRLKSSIHLASTIFEDILHSYKIKIETKKTTLYSKLPYKTTGNILAALPKPVLKYEAGMKLHLIDVSSDLVVKNSHTTIDEYMAEALNTNEQEELAKYF